MKKAQKRMQAIVERLESYWLSYDQQASYLDYTDTTLIDDALYGLGIAIDKAKYSGASGYERFKAEVLLPRLAPTVEPSRLMTQERLSSSSL